MLRELSENIVVCGRYGTGKTSLSASLALYYADAGEKVVAADLDIVNPYFRTADFTGIFRQKGIEMIIPLYANTNLDMPVIPPGLRAEIPRRGRRLIIDVGGDDDGAVALGGYSDVLRGAGYTMLCTVSGLREPGQRPQDDAALISDMQRASRLKAGYIVSNTNLGPETDRETILKGEEYARAVSRLTGLPVLMTAVPEPLKPCFDGEEYFPMSVLVKAPWQL